MINSQGAEQSYDSSIEGKIVNEKKAAAKDQLKILKNFDSMADQFQNKVQKPIVQDAKAEKAGAIRKASRSREKKEKTLSAKLRLKTKKNN